MSPRPAPTALNTLLPASIALDAAAGAAVLKAPNPPVAEFWFRQKRPFWEMEHRFSPLCGRQLLWDLLGHFSGLFHSNQAADKKAAGMDAGYKSHFGGQQEGTDSFMWTGQGLLGQLPQHAIRIV